MVQMWVGGEDAPTLLESRADRRTVVVGHAYTLKSEQQKARLRTMNTNCEGRPGSVWHASLTYCSDLGRSWHC
jgi:hypothetical protein